MADTTEQDASRIIRHLLPEAKDIQILEFLSGGWGNDNFKVRIDDTLFALRVSRNGNQSAEHEIEYLQSEAAPNLFVYDRESKHYLTRWVDGYPPESKPLSPRAAASFLQGLHRAVPMGVCAYDARNKILKMYANGQASSHDYRVFNEISWYPRELIGCHNDLNPWNLLVGETSITTLDWESGGDNEPLYDLVGLTYGMRFSDADTIECARIYAGKDLDLDYLLDTRLVYLCREQAWAMEQVVIGNARPEVKNQINEARTEMLRLFRQRNRT